MQRKSGSTAAEETKGAGILVVRTGVLTSTTSTCRVSVGKRGQNMRRDTELDPSETLDTRAEKSKVKDSLPVKLYRPVSTRTARCRSSSIFASTVRVGKCF